MRCRSLAVLALTSTMLIGSLGARADQICDPLSDPGHRPSQWEHLCHQGLRGEVPNDPTQKNPSSRFSFAPSTGIQTGTVITFDGSASNTRDGTLNTQADNRPMRDWRWDFGDGGQASGKIVTHAYRQTGEYVAELWVHDSIGWRAHSSKLVDVGTLPATGAVRELFTVASGAEGGVTLQGAVTRPDAEGQYPVILTFGPYCPYTLADTDKTMALVRSGYAFATVVAPGLCGSSGTFDMFGAQTQRAGYDAVEALASKPWSNGKVALTGFSGPAVGALLTAGSSPPHLVAASIMATYADQYRDQIYPGGIPNSNSFVNAWRTLLLNDPMLQTDPQRIVGNWEQNIADMATRSTVDNFWKERSIVDYPPPAAHILYIGSDHDLWPRSAFEIARWIRPGGGRVVQCVGSHGCGDPSGWETPEFLPAAGDARAWLDHWMKGNDNGAESRPGILTYATRGGDIAGYGFDDAQWIGLDSWPGSISTWKRLYLDGTPSTGTIRGLSDAVPTGAGALGPDVVVADPLQGAAKGNTSSLGDGTGLPEAQEVDDAHTLVYETPIATGESAFAGPITLTLYASLASPDFAWSAQIEDVWPDGSSNWIREGYLLASHRALDESRTLRNDAGDIVRPYHPHTAASAQTLLPGAIYRFDIEIWGVSNILAPGHRLRLSLAGQNAGWRQNAEPGAALVFHDTSHPSSLLLPMVELGADPHPFALP